LASIKDLLAVTQARNMLEGSFAQTDAMLRSTAQKAFSKVKLSPRQEKIFQDRQGKLIEIAKEDLSYDVLEPLVIDIYQKSFTEKEVKGMLTFYKSEAGKAVIAKIPLVNQQALQLIQNRAEKLTPKLEQWCTNTVIPRHLGISERSV